MSNQQTRTSKFLQWINYRVRVTIQDSRILVGTLIAFDKHMNLVMADTEEYRKLKPRKQKEESKTQQETGEREVKRALGLILLRGENIVTMSAEAPPSQAVRKIGQGIQAPQQPQGRGVPMPP